MIIDGIHVTVLARRFSVVWTCECGLHFYAYKAIDRHCKEHPKPHQTRLW